jgi:K+-sensing histidine kinase KdpD
LLGSTISAGIAALLAFLVRGSNRSVIVPIVFIIVIILCARSFGLLAGVLGSIIGASLFALFLFEPYGSFRVNDRQALSNLALLLFAGIALSYANSERGDRKPAARPLKPH